jgi:hypothetical protein
MNDKDLLSELEAQKALMIAVATGGPRIEEANPEYVNRKFRILNALADRKLKDPNPHRDLWAWYGKWSSGDLPNYQSRRQYISDVYGELIDSLVRQTQGDFAARPAEPTGWTRVDRNLEAARRHLETSLNEEEFQTVGLLCRETLISLAQAVFDPVRHPTLDGVESSQTDAKRMLEAYIARELGGSANEALRKHAKAAFDLANTLQHRRTATFRDAALCAEATTAVVNSVAIVSGRRDPLLAGAT